MKGEAWRRAGTSAWRALAFLAPWGALFAIAAWNALAREPICIRGAGLSWTVLLVPAAAWQALRKGSFLHPEERRILPAVLLCFLAAQLVYRASVSSSADPYGTGPHHGIDFSAYYLAAKAVAAGGHPNFYSLPLYGDGRVNLASQAAAGSAWYAAAQRYGIPFAMPFLYPPFVALLVEPLARLSFATAHQAWLVLSVALYLAGAALAFQLCGIAPSMRMLLPAGVGLLCFFPLIDQLSYGQIDSVIFVLLAGALLLLAKSRTVGSSLCFAAAALVKLTPLLLLPIFVIHRKGRWLAAYAGWTAMLLALSVLRSGVGIQKEFAAGILPHLACGSPVVTNSSLVAWVQELAAGQVFNWADAPAQLPAHACAASRGLAAVVYSAALLRMYQLRKERTLLRDLMAGILLTLLVSPISWWHHYVVALLPLLYFARHGGRTVAPAARCLLFAVATNAAGWGAATAVSPAARLGFAAVVPGLLLVVLGAEYWGRDARGGALLAEPGLAEAARLPG